MDSPTHPPTGLKLTDLRSVFYFTRFAGQAGFAPWVKYRPPFGRQLFHPLQKTQPSAIADEAHPWRGGPHLRTTQHHHSPLPSPLSFSVLILFTVGWVVVVSFYYFSSFICIYGWVNCGCSTSTTSSHSSVFTVGWVVVVLLPLLLLIHLYLRLGELYLVCWGSKAFIPYKFFHYFIFTE